MNEFPINLVYTDNEHLIPARLCSVKDEVLSAYCKVPLSIGTFVTLVMIKSRCDLKVISSTKMGNDFIIEVRACEKSTKFSDYFSSFDPVKAIS